jgi:hypothetical protein
MKFLPFSLSPSFTRALRRKQLVRLAAKRIAKLYDQGPIYSFHAGAHFWGQATKSDAEGTRTHAKTTFNQIERR